MKSFESWRRERLGLLWWLIALYMMVAVAVALTGCAPRVVPESVAVHDTLYIGHDTRDSIYLHDSLYIREYMRGDTVYRDKLVWREMFVDKWKRDTIYISRMDTLTVKVTEYKQTKWQKATSNIGVTFLIGLVAFFLAQIYHKRKYKNLNQ